MPTPSPASILVIDDQVEMARVLADGLADAGHQVTVADGGRAALTALEAQRFDLVVTDLRMEQVDGFDVLARVKAIDPDVPVLIMTAFGAVDTAIKAIREGAYDYFTKPFRLDEVMLTIGRALADRRLRTENASLRRLADERTGLGSMVGRSPPMRRLYELIERVASAGSPALVLGESGSGKELVARAIHLGGERKARPFVAVNCSTLPEALLESELFGHVKGAFTGATAARQGLFAEADGGSILLDEIGELPLGLQPKLLRVLEEGSLRAVGSDEVRKIDVRMIAATHQDLEQRVREQRFRLDLFYRLNVLPVPVPPLRERVEDIPALAERFLERARERNPSSRVRRLSPELISALARHRWPGNVRELENLIERLVVISTCECVELPELALCAPAILAGPSPLERAREAPVPLRQLEAEYIGWVVGQCGGNKTRAAEILGIDVSTIHRKGRRDGDG